MVGFLLVPILALWLAQRFANSSTLLRVRHAMWLDAAGPRIAAFARRHRPDRYRIVPEASSGEPMLHQFAIIRGGSWLGRRVGALYLQHFERPEPRAFAHVHRWSRMRSWVLSGLFEEERFVNGAVEGYADHVAGETYTMDREVVHRVEYWSKRCWTLFWMSPETRDDWGWFPVYDRDLLGATLRWRDDKLVPLRWHGEQLIPWREHILARRNHRFVAKRVESLDVPGKFTP